MYEEEAAAVEQCNGVVSHAARRLGIPRSTLIKRLEIREREAGKIEDRSVGSKADIDKKKGVGWLELTEYEMPSEEEVLKRHNLDPACWRVTRVTPNQWQGFIKNSRKEPEKVTLYSLRIYVERCVSEPIESVARTLASRIKPLPSPNIRRKKRKGEQLGVFGLYDAHIGALSWDGETDQNNNTDMAVTRCKSAIDDIEDYLSRFPVDKLIVPIGNDFAHYDNERGETSSGKVITDFDSRYANMVLACHDVLACLGDACLRVCDDVTYLLVGGNHDRVTSLHLALWMEQRYTKDKRVSVDTGMRARKYVSWNEVLLGFAHGDRLSPKECYRHMAEEAREYWASARCREFHTGDKHHRKDIDLTVTDTMGRVTFRQNPSLSPRDLHTYKNGWDSVRCADVYRYGSDGFLGMETTYAK